MRTDIYYRKCDNPLSIEEKLIYNDKYKLADITELVKAIAVHHFGTEPVSIEPTGATGNHYSYYISYPDKTYFFRSDDGKIEDDYMDAEKVAIELAKQHGVPVPEVTTTDTSKQYFPVRYQLMGKVPGQSMKVFFQDGSLNKDKVSKDLGRYLAKLHSVKADGFGFINTQALREDGKIIGLDATNRDYFNKKLEDHFTYLQTTGFLTSKEIDEIKALFEKFEHHLDIPQGYLVHKDIAFWNMVGTADTINAIVDRDDVIIGDPIDDLAVIRCFFGDDIFIPLLEGYQEVASLPPDFYPRLRLYLSRNMIRKAVFRTFMKSFDIQGKVDLLNRDKAIGLKEFTYNQLYLGINNLKNL